MSQPPSTPYRDLLRMLAQGLTNEQIGQRTGRSKQAVSMRLYRLRKHMKARSTTNAVALAYERGILKMGDAGPS